MFPCACILFSRCRSLISSIGSIQCLRPWTLVSAAELKQKTNDSANSYRYATVFFATLNGRKRSRELTSGEIHSQLPARSIELNAVETGGGRMQSKRRPESSPRGVRITTTSTTHTEGEVWVSPCY